MIYEINHIWTAEMKWRWRNDRRSERNLCNCVKKREKKKKNRKKIRKNSGLQRGWSPEFFFQASLRSNWINCVQCDDHFFIFLTSSVGSDVELRTRQTNQMNQNYQKRLNIHYHTNFRFISLVCRVWRSTFVLETIFRCSIRLKLPDRTCWTLTHSDEPSRARRRTFHGLNSPKFISLLFPMLATTGEQYLHLHHYS